MCRGVLLTWVSLILIIFIIKKHNYYYKTKPPKSLQYHYFMSPCVWLILIWKGLLYFRYQQPRECGQMRAISFQGEGSTARILHFPPSRSCQNHWKSTCLCRTGSLRTLWSLSNTTPSPLTAIRWVDWSKDLAQDPLLFWEKSFIP